MANTIFLLEDDADRTASMREVLATHFASHELVFIDNAPDLIEWLRQHLREAVLICLDHDLGPNRKRNGETFDPGIGRDVVEYMATLEPVHYRPVRFPKAIVSDHVPLLSIHSVMMSRLMRSFFNRLE